MGGICNIECPTWDYFVQLVRNTREGRKAGGRIYRGHADPTWKLSSKFERWLDAMRGHGRSQNIRRLFGQSGPEAFEAGYLRRFKEAAIGMPNLRTDNFTDDDWWVLGRHHGLITRLLDWSYSPYIAAFFAFAEYAHIHFDDFREGIPAEAPKKWEGSKVVIWALSPYREIFNDTEFKIVSARRDDFYRQRAQAGLFTWLRHDVHLDLQSYLESREIADYLERIEVPSIEVGKALNDLRLMNITYATLFPDPDGAARDANLAPMVAKLHGSGIEVRLKT